MKHYGLAIIAGLFSFNVAVAEEIITPIPNVEVHSTKSNKLSIQNLSYETIKIDIYGKELNLQPASGVTFQCEGYKYLEILFSDLVHDYFEVPCQSQVVINESFESQK